MKNKFITLALASLAFTACTNDDAISLDKELHTNNQNKVVLMAEDDAQQAFAKILSKAVYNDLNVREFIKSEAIRQFDNDYDILYAFVKDKEVASGYTFRDALLNYCEDENVLISIEQSLPLLNILVPDLTFISSFKADNWDLSDEEVPVSYDKDHNSGVLFVNGDSITYLEPNEIPDFPVLVVKNNERMVASATTRADGTSTYSYEFFDDAFNGSLRNNTRAEYDVTYPEEPTDNSQISEYELASINPAIRQAFFEFPNNTTGKHRDYVYYGMTNANQTNGHLDTNVREILYKFRIVPSQIPFIADQTGDPVLQSISKSGGEFTQEEVRSKIWKEGNFEFLFDVMTGTKSGNVLYNRLAYSATPRELFSINKVHVVRKHSTAFSHSKYTYTVTNVNEAVTSKWIRTNSLTNGNYIQIGSWDIFEQSLRVNIALLEKDDSETIVKTHSVSNEFAGNANFSFGSDSIVKVALGVSGKTTSTTSKSVTITKNSDDLGSLSFYYYDPIIKSRTLQGNIPLYDLYTVTNGAFEIIVLPENIN